MKAKRKNTKKQNKKKTKITGTLVQSENTRLEFVPGYDDDDNLVCLLFAPHVMRHGRSELRGFSPDFYNETTQ